MKSQSGFTLIELVIAIIVIGILSTYAIPKLVNINDDAKIAVTDSMASTLSTGITFARAQHELENRKGFITVDKQVVLFRVDGEVKDYPQVSSSAGCSKLWNTLTEGERASDLEGEFIHSVFYEGVCEFSIEEQIFTYISETGEVIRV